MVSYNTYDICLSQGSHTIKHMIHICNNYKAYALARAATQYKKLLYKANTYVHYSCLPLMLSIKGNNEAPYMLFSWTLRFHHQVSLKIHYNVKISPFLVSTSASHESAFQPIGQQQLVLLPLTCQAMSSPECLFVERKTLPAETKVHHLKCM